MKVQIGIFQCTGMVGQDLVHPYNIQSTTVFCDIIIIHKSADSYVTVVVVSRQLDVAVGALM